MTCGIYIIQAPSKKCYVGQSVNVKKRLQQHVRALNKGTHYNKALQRAHIKYGATMDFSRVITSIPAEHLCEVEQLLIDMLAPSVYNIRPVEPNGFISEDMRRAMSDRMRAKNKEPGFREAEAIRVAAYWANPLNKVKHSAIAKQTMNNPKNKTQLIARLKIRHTDPEFKKTWSDGIKAHHTKADVKSGYAKRLSDKFKDPVYMQAHKDRLTARMKDPLFKAAHAERMAARMRDPEYREKVHLINSSHRQLKRDADTLAYGLLLYSEIGLRKIYGKFGDPKTPRQLAARSIFRNYTGKK